MHLSVVHVDGGKKKGDRGGVSGRRRPPAEADAAIGAGKRDGNNEPRNPKNLGHDDMSMNFTASSAQPGLTGSGSTIAVSLDAASFIS
ncbi:MAG: hypothetical protein VB934_01405 [Polyangiaceae bacterium]